MKFFSSVCSKMEDIESTIQIEVQDVLAELDFLHKVDQRRDLYEAGVVRRAVHRWEGKRGKHKSPKQ